MKRQIVQRIFIGLPAGIAIGHLIAVAISLVMGHGQYDSVVPTLVAQMGSEIAAVVLQTGLCGALGMGFSVADLIWQRDDWSILKQLGLYFAVAAALMMPVAYALHWMRRTWLGFLIYLGVFVLIFLVIFAVQYLVYRHKVKVLNQTMKQ